MSRALSYSQINSAVNEVFLGGRHNGLPVYLDLDERLADELATRIGVEKSTVAGAIGTAVANTLLWDHRSNIYLGHDAELKKWRRAKGSAPPPFSALLLCFSAAAARMREDQEFAATNYYRRLLEVLSVPPGPNNRNLDALHASARETEKFWEALNRWLVETDYAFGEPTATHYNANTRYVSYAVSQSLVREVDRQHLRDMLLQYGLSRGDKVTGHEMTLFIDRWMKNANGPTLSLRRSWTRQDRGLKLRIAEIALAELESLTETPAIEGPAKQLGRRLTWVLIERDAFPRVELRLYLAVAAPGQDLGSLRLLGGDSAGSVDHLSFSPLGATDLQCLGPVGRLNLERLLIASTSLEGARGQRFTHDARAIIPFYRSEDATYWQECPRAFAFTRHFLICHKSWRDRVVDHLQKYAAPGYVEIPSTPSGVPPTGWVAFRNVTLSSNVSDDIREELQVLVPQKTGEVFNYVGGLKLARNMWHADAPPVLYIEAPGSLESVCLRDTESTIFEVGGKDFSPTFLAADSLVRDGQNFTIVARARTSSVTGTISFRSAESPRWFSQDSAEFLYYSFGERAGLAWGQGATKVRGDVGLTGLYAEGLPVPGEASREFAATCRIKDSYGEPEDVENYDDTPAGTEIHTCILRKYHYFDVDDDNVSMRCRDCNTFLWVREFKEKARKMESARRRALHARVNPARPVATRERVSRPEPLAQSEGISLDVVYDAACYKAFGSWDALSQLLAVCASDPLDVVNSYRALVDLGLIDVEMDQHFARPVRWSVPPPVLSATSRGTLVMSGFRSRSLIEKITSILGDFGCEHRVERFRYAPATHHWTLACHLVADVAALLGGITDPFGRKLKVTDEIADRIAGAMPSITDLFRSLRTIHVEHTVPVERFDPTRGNWTTAQMTAPGAYRCQLYGITYFFHDGTKSYQAGHELVKILAARHARRYLHACDDEHRRFESLLGCEPPGLFRRALVACSGTLPGRMDGKLVYESVSRKTANLVLERLYG